MFKHSIIINKKRIFKTKLLFLAKRIINSPALLIKIICIIVIGVFFLAISYNIYQSGYQRGQKNAEKKATSKVALEYEPQITALQSKLDTLIKNYENKLAVLKKEYSTTINALQNEHIAETNAINAGHEAEMSQMRKFHQTNIEITKKSSYEKGQTDMKNRIDNVIDMNITNKERKHNWNDTVLVIE